MRQRHSMRTGLMATAMAGCLCAGPKAHAETDFSRLNPDERAVLNDILTDVLANMPGILGDPRAHGPMPDRPTPRDEYEEAVADDLAQIEKYGEALFAPTLPGFGMPSAAHVLALFVREGCPDCARAEADLRVLAQAHDLRVTLLDMDRNRSLADALGLDIAPSYVLPDMMLRGHIPPVVLEKYLSR